MCDSCGSSVVFIGHPTDQQLSLPIATARFYFYKAGVKKENTITKFNKILNKQTFRWATSYSTRTAHLHMRATLIKKPQSKSY